MRQRKCVLAAGIIVLALSRCEAIEDEAKDVVVMERKRSLRVSGSFFDPKSTELKQHLNILALGGSITWGAELQEREQEAFPMLIGELYNDSMGGTLDVSVDNLAIRASGADYPSLCLQSLLSEANPADPDKSYDLILLDFMLNGIWGLPALMHRLRGRFPDAEIIMVELWSLKSSIEEVGTKLTVHETGPEADREWTWKDNLEESRARKPFVETEALMGAFNARYVTIPRPPTPRDAIEHDWFSLDWHHPTAYGHSVIAKTVFDFLTKRSNIPLMTGKRVGEWDLGDECYNWFSTGNVLLSYDGATLSELSALDGLTRSFLEIDEDGASIEFVSRFDRPVQFSLGYMSRRQPAMYPKVHVHVENDEIKGDLDNNQSLWTINPSINHALDSTVHMCTYMTLGYVFPGRNVIKIVPMEHATKPFRVVGVYLCAVCTPRKEALAMVEKKHQPPLTLTF